MLMRRLEDLPDQLKPRSASNLLLWGITAFVLIFFTWAYFAEIERTVRGQGRVIPSSQLQVVSNNEGGIVQDILVRSGDMVRAGAPLIRLDPTATGSELGSGEASYNALLIKIARLEAEVAGRAPTYPSPPDPQAAEQIRIEQALHASRIADLASISGAAEARVAQARRAVAEAEAAYQARVTNRDARIREANIIRPLVERGIEPRLSLVQAESAASIASSEAAGAAQSIARAQASVVEAQQALSQLRQNWRREAATELAAAQAEVVARQRALPALAQRVDRTVLRAPLAGRINRVLVTTRGSAVQAAQPLVEIVPSDDSLLVEARVTPEDISFVRMGQEARVAITAYDQSIYGTLEARVVHISPDAITDEESGQSFYVVRVRTSTNQIRSPTGEVMPIGPGMVADVSLLGDRRTVLQYILTPITRLSERAFTEQ
jgi:membrane fusion protein, adhesin transport system